MDVKALLKNPKLVGSIIVIILGVLMTMVADLKPILGEICAQIELKQDAPPSLDAGE